jgi:hypothetical protein
LPPDPIENADLLQEAQALLGLVITRSATPLFRLGRGSRSQLNQLPKQAGYLLCMLAVSNRRIDFQPTEISDKLAKQVAQRGSTIVMSEAGDVGLQPLMPPYRVYHSFLEAGTRAGLLAWAIENKAKFEPTKLGQGADARHDPTKRISLRTRDFGPMKALIRQRMLDLIPALIRDLRVTRFEPSKVTRMAHSSSAISTP